MTREESEKLKAGTVVYFPDNESVQVGIFDGTCTDSGELYVDLIELADHRYVNGEHISSFRTEKKWKPLPKGWTYDTKLFEIEYRIGEHELKRRSELRLDRPEDILAGLEEGVIVLAKEVYHGSIEAEIDKHKGWRIRKEYPHWTLTYGKPNMEYRRVSAKDLFLDYASAKNRIEEIRENRRKEAEMSDEEWSIREIEKVLRFFDADTAKKYREELFGISNIADVEVRKRNGILEWRYFEKKSKWTPVIEMEAI